MRNYFSLGNDEYIGIDWGDSLKRKRGCYHIGCNRERRGRTVGQIVYRAASSCLGPEELAGNEESAINIYIRDISSRFRKDTRCYEVEFYRSFSARLEVKGSTVGVFHHPDADVEILVDDVFQMALSEVVRDAGGWVFHASGVSYGDQGLLLVGSSVSGKSTACLTLLLGGFCILGDDASLVIERDSCYWAVPMAQEVSVRLQAISLFQPTHQIILNPVGERFFWRQATGPPGPVPLKVICSLEIEGGEETHLEEVAPREFCKLFQHKPPLHGFNRSDFERCVETLSQKGIRFVKGRLGVSPQATLEAYIKCLEDPERGYWQGRGNRRVMTLGEGRKLVGRSWTDPKISSLKDLIPLMAHPSEGMARSAQMVLATDPLSDLEPLPWEDYNELWAFDEESEEEVDWCRLKEWKDGTRSLLESANWRFVEEKVDGWLRTAPVLYPFLRHHSREDAQLQSIIDEKWREYLAWKYPPQLMLYLTDYCQLRCPYCYAMEKVRQGGREMAWEKVEWLLDWAQEQNFSFISLTGGEPTLYPRFSELVNSLKIREFPFYFATNLLFPPSLGRWIEGVANLEIHLCDPQDYPASQLGILKGNLKWLRKQSFPKVFRYNLWRRKLSDWEWVTNIVQEFADSNFAFAVPFPSPTRQNLFLARKQLDEFAMVVVEFVHFCEQRGIKAITAKPYPLCAFSGEEALYLLEKGALRGTCEIGASDCTRNLVVDPDFRVFPCIALDISPGSVAALSTLKPRLKRIVSEFFKYVDYERCRSCELRSWKLCMGGCLAYYRSLEYEEIPMEGEKSFGKHTSYQLL